MLKELLGHGIEMTALHSHMLDEQPRLFFMHFWANDDAQKLAADFFASQPQSSAVISNLGVLPLAADYGPLMLKATWGPAMLTNLPVDRQTIGISTFAGGHRLQFADRGGHRRHL